MTQDTENETLLEFPCEFSVKAMGLATDEFETLVVDIVSHHVPDLHHSASKSRPSSNGKYLSVTVTFTAENKAQLDAMYIELSAHDSVIMAL